MNRVPRYTVLKKGFREAFKMVPDDQRMILIRSIQDSLGWSIATFYNRLNGSIPVRISEKQILFECFEAFGIDIWAVTKN